MTASPRQKIHGDTTPHILIVEDDASDALLTRIAFDEENIPCEITEVNNGRDALDFLTRRKAFSNAPKPDLVLLDLNIPGLGGKKILETIRSNADLRNIPVMLFTSSSSPRDIDDCYHLQANCYIVKPGSMEERRAIVRRVERFLNKTGITAFLHH